MARLVLVGGGHAHVEVLRQLERRATTSEVLLISPDSHLLYTGALPAALRGDLAPGAFTVDLAGLCHRARVRFLQSRVTSLFATANGVAVSTEGNSYEADVCSLNIGASVVPDNVPGALQYALGVKPAERWHQLVRVFHAVSAGEFGVQPRVTVVGAGAGGVELMLALAAMVREPLPTLSRGLPQSGRAHSRASSRSAPPAVRAELSIVSLSNQVLPSMGSRASAIVTALLNDRGIAVRSGHRVTEVTPQGVVLADGSVIPSDVVVWAAGVSAPTLLRHSNLLLSDGGFLSVDETLQAAGNMPVFGAGDCITFSAAPTLAKAGVHAVREGPVLAHNLFAQFSGNTAMLQRFTPNSQALSIVDTSETRALLHWHGVTIHSRWAWRLKQWIDRRWIARYR
ncbi:MAG: FAD-dependent oxidoreductase [Phycisphaerae bacterium]|nr:FAD-dependent oxidoreductase [Gemmatimonadaceae bacterium]